MVQAVEHSIKYNRQARAVTYLCYLENSRDVQQDKKINCIRDLSLYIDAITVFSRERVDAKENRVARSRSGS